MSNEEIPNAKLFPIGIFEAKFFQLFWEME